MIYEDFFGTRLWKPRGARVYLDIIGRNSNAALPPNASLISQYPTTGMNV